MYVENLDSRSPEKKDGEWTLLYIHLLRKVQKECIVVFISYFTALVQYNREVTFMRIKSNLLRGGAKRGSHFVDKFHHRWLWNTQDECKIDG